MPAPNHQQSEFVGHLVRSGCNPTEAARRAGYATPKNAAYRLLRLDHVAGAIRGEQRRLIDNDLATGALGTLRAVMEDDEAPASARVSAARVVLEMSGHRRQPEAADPARDKALAEMSVNELEEIVRRGREQLVLTAPETLAN